MLLENRVFAEKRVLVRENESISLFLSLASCKLYHIKSVCQERETNQLNPDTDITEPDQYTYYAYARVTLCVYMCR